MSLERLTERAREALKLMQQKATERAEKLGKEAREVVNAIEIMMCSKAQTALLLKY